MTRARTPLFSRRERRTIDETFAICDAARDSRTTYAHACCRTPAIRRDARATLLVNLVSRGAFRSTGRCSACALACWQVNSSSHQLPFGRLRNTRRNERHIAAALPSTVARAGSDAGCAGGRASAASAAPCTRARLTSKRIACRACTSDETVTRVMGSDACAAIERAATTPHPGGDLRRAGGERRQMPRSSGVFTRDGVPVERKSLARKSGREKSLR